MVDEIKEGPKVMSNKNIADQYINDKKGFEIKVGEIKNLPTDYEKSNLINSCLKKGDLVLMNKPENVKGDIDVTLDEKDVGNFLNQNTSTVIKQLKINELSKKDLNKLLSAERNGKKRDKIVKFIKTLKEVE